MLLNEEMNQVKTMLAQLIQEKSESVVQKNTVEELHTTRRTESLPNLQHPPFILEEDTNYTVWKNIVFNDFKSFNYEYLLDKAKQEPELSTKERERRIGFANSYLLSRIIENYKNLICYMKKPAEILAKIEVLKYPKVSSSRFSIKPA